MQDYNQFISTICENQKVYILSSEDGIATSISKEFEYEDENNLEAICFWSTEELAQKTIFNQWSNHQPTPISLAIFLEEWLVGMFQEVSIVGIDFNKDILGIERDPLDVMLSIVQELKQKNIDIKLNHFKNLEDIRTFALDLKAQYNM